MNGEVIYGIIITNGDTMDNNMKMISGKKRMNIKAFRELGYLQELNRQFLHPLGLALEVVIDDDGTESIGGVWDYREDNGGIYYGIAQSDSTRKKSFSDKALFIEKEKQRIGIARRMLLGFDVEPIENTNAN